jgi:hypothetical protein
MYVLILLHIGDPVPEEDEEPERQNHNDWAWLPLFAALTTLAYLWTPKQDPIPEVSFPFFLQHMLYTGEVYKNIMLMFYQPHNIGPLMLSALI